MCSRCDLYGDPDDEVAARAAAEHARRSFIRMHGDPGRMVPLGKGEHNRELMALEGSSLTHAPCPSQSSLVRSCLLTC